MQNTKKLTNDLFYIGVNDRKIALFESVYPVSDGISYNSYFLNDEKTVLFDTVDKDYSIQFFENLDYLLNKKALDYLIINHLEPDHSALIKEVVKKFPNIKIVLNQKAKQMLLQFFEFDFDIEKNIQIVKEGDILETGKHKLTFVMAPMVHWPEVMVTYDLVDKILFSADAFGAFGALDGNIFDTEVDFDKKIDEYRRYYTNIVGKYGAQTQMLLNKASALEIKMICPLHGLIIKENIQKLIDLHINWANYTPEKKSVLLLYSSVYGNTQNAVEVLANKLAQKSIKDIKIFDVSRVHHSFILSKCFEYSHIVLATTTYNNDIFINMKHFIDDLVSHNLQNRTYAIIQNGSWAPTCALKIKEELEKLKGSSFIEKQICIKSTLKQEQDKELDELADEINKNLKG
ncbi:MAG: FprA family A-type flavoprotein [Candidatus Gastranaerophilales bacterium]|nr:FprA family A-type flavoprotein [Candidatus Gastranaerophilales bacterium]